LRSQPAALVAGRVTRVSSPDPLQRRPRTAECEGGVHSLTCRLCETAEWGQWVRLPDRLLHTLGDVSAEKDRPELRSCVQYPVWTDELPAEGRVTLALACAPLGRKAAVCELRLELLVFRL
jgi:hypothetical protein